MSDASPSEVADAVRELDSVRGDWLRRPGVTGVDVGFSRTGRGAVAIRVYVERKLPRAALLEHEVFPERLGRFPVEVIEATFGPQEA